MKKGFTLAEILITLTIVGVVAALTLPALMTNVSQAKVGPALAKFTNTFENGVRQYLFENDTSSLTAIEQPVVDKNGNSQPTFLMDTTLSALGKYIIWANPDTDTYNNYAIHKPSGESILLTLSQYYPKVLKDGSLVLFGNDASLPGARDHDYSGTSLKGILGIVYYDINGFAKPNTLSKDVFVFALDKSGILVPIGSSMYNTITKSDLKCEPTAGTVGAMACTGKVADNGWKADY